MAREILTKILNTANENKTSGQHDHALTTSWKDQLQRNECTFRWRVQMGVEMEENLPIENRSWGFIFQNWAIESVEIDDAVCSSHIEQLALVADIQLSCDRKLWSNETKIHGKWSQYKIVKRFHPNLLNAKSEMIHFFGKPACCGTVYRP